jgi:hypothetical protein
VLAYLFLNQNCARNAAPYLFAQTRSHFSPKFLQNTYAQTPNFFWFITQRGATLAKKIILSTFLDEIFTPFHFSPTKHSSAISAENALSPLSGTQDARYSTDFFCSKITSTTKKTAP